MTNLNDTHQSGDKDEHYISKSQLKREVEALQLFGMKLSELPTETLKNIILEPKLLEALLFVKNIKSNGAKRRQMQYIGKLMRSADAKRIQQDYERLLHNHRQQQNQFHYLEEWRDKLLTEGDIAVNALIHLKPDLDRVHLRQLIRNATKEKEINKPPKSARQLFQYLKDNI